MLKCVDCHWYLYRVDKHGFHHHCTNPLFIDDPVTGIKTREDIPCRVARQYEPDKCGLLGRHWRQARSINKE